MHKQELKKLIPANIYEFITFPTLRPAQFKAIQAGIFQQKNLLICTPTASGKTLVAEFAMLDCVLNRLQKAVYIVPLKALANEKYNEFKKKYPDVKVGKSTGDIDGTDAYLAAYDIIIVTSEKLDSLMRHHTPWISDIGLLVIDEIHQLNDASRGPTLEVVITLLKHPKRQIIGLSATIGNPQELAEWLEAEAVIDLWRPTRLEKGIYTDHLEILE